MHSIRALNLLSIVVPAYNEAANLALLYERVREVVNAMGCDWELIVVDDGSPDDTANILRQLHHDDARVRALLLSRNFGHEAACTAGLDAAQGDAVILMDADLQDPPELIETFVAHWRDGYDIVSGQRTSRTGDSLAKRFLAYSFYRVMNRLVTWDFPIDTGNFRLMDRTAVDALKMCRERNRFVRALTAWSGFKQCSVPFSRKARHADVTKYSFRKVAGLALTGLTGYSNDPLRVASIAGLLLLALSMAGAIYLAVAGFRGNGPSIGAYILVSVWFIGGLQCVLIGLLGEYVGRIYTEARHRPLYFVRESIGLNATSRDQSTR